MSYTKTIKEAALEAVRERFPCDPDSKPRTNELHEMAEYDQDLAFAIYAVGVVEAEQLFAAEFAEQWDNFISSQEETYRWE
jgi:hypothetical protein